MYKIVLVSGNEIFFTEDIYSRYLSIVARNEDRFILRGGDKNNVILTLHIDKVVYTAKYDSKFSESERTKMRDTGVLFNSTQPVDNF